jgi:glycine/D-amino acid oxidase-like deaminating enzyme/nitrite reductase/ring-hydroxylating ferredoxin subunit
VWKYRSLLSDACSEPFLLILAKSFCNMKARPADPLEKARTIETEQETAAVNENITSGAHKSYWVDSVQPLFTKKLDRDRDTDVVVIGGGIAGMTTAYLIRKSGKQVILVEDGCIGSGETGRTTAHLVTALDDRYYTLQEKFGERKTRLIAESQRMAIDFIERIVQEENISCDFERLPGYLFLHPTDDPQSLLRELQAASESVLDVTEIAHVPGMKSYQGSCLRFDRQAQFHPMKYLGGLCNSFLRNGGEVFTETHASQIDSSGIVSKEGFRITAKHVVVATNTPVSNKYIPHLKQYAYRTYVIGARVKKGSVPKALWWDTGDHSTDADIPPYHYVRTQPLDEMYDLLICGGEDHPTGLADATSIPEKDRYMLLEHWARERFPIEDVVYKWSGQVMEPMDGLAFIGRNPMSKDNMYIITGDSGNGMTNGTFAGMLISDLVNNRKNKWEKVYNPSRFKLITAGKTFFKEVVAGLVNYIRTKPKGEPNDIHDLKAGEGKVIEMEGKKYGVFRDGSEQLHLVSADCTHMKCTVKWNPDEKSWDCPCHGSRFSWEGRVMHGPANADLEYHQEPMETFAHQEMEHQEQQHH